MATTSSTTKAKQNLTRTKSLGRKPKLPSSEDESNQKPEKPLPNYLKPTISSRPDPVKFLKKNNNSVDDSKKLLRRRSFDRPPSSLTSPSTSSHKRIPKSLNVSPSRPRDRPVVPREKPIIGLRSSSSFHGSRGGTTVKSPQVGPKKSGLRSSNTSLKGKKEGSAKASDKEIVLDSASLSSAQEDEEEILKVDSEIQVSNDIEQLKDEKEAEELQIEVAKADESADDENANGEPTTVVSPVEEDSIGVAKEIEEEEEEEKLIKEEKAEDKTEETKEQEDNQENKGEQEEEIEKKIEEDETLEKVDNDIKDVESVEETTKEKEEEKNEEEKVEEEEEKEQVKEEETEKVKEEEDEEESGEGKKKEVVKGKKESPSAYNDVIASKMQENPRKNKVLALAGAFQTVIDYETAASK